MQVTLTKRVDGANVLTVLKARPEVGQNTVARDVARIDVRDVVIAAARKISFQRTLPDLVP